MTDAARPFIVIGENIHTTRIVKVDGVRMMTADDGRPAVRVPTPDGDRPLPVPDLIQDTRDFRSGRVKHVMAAVMTGVEGRPETDLAIAYIHWMADRQTERGAHYLDVNVDEISPDMDGRIAAMRWLIDVLGPHVRVPLAIDSSDAQVMAVALERYDAAWGGGGRPLLNSAAADRMDVLAMAAERRLPVVLSATGVTMPNGTEERVERAIEMVDAATAAGIPLADLHVDPLVIPIGVDAEAGTMYLDAVRAIRARYGPELHITGGLSNVSFGMPARRLINDVFLDLAVQAGQDSGVVDPVAADIAAALAPDRDSEPYRLAAGLLTGADPFGMEFIEAFRAGRLEPAPA